MLTPDGGLGRSVTPQNNGRDIIHSLKNRSTLKDKLRSIAISFQIWPSYCNSFICNACKDCKNELQLNHYKLYLLIKHELNLNTYIELTGLFIPHTIRNIGKELFHFCMFTCLQCSKEKLCHICLNQLKKTVDILF